MVSGTLFIQSPTVTVTAGAYHANDNIGGLLTLTNVAESPGVGLRLTQISVVDSANQKAQLEFLFFSSNPSASTFTNNDAPVIHANDVSKYLGRVAVMASDYLTVGAKAVACVSNIGLALVANASRNLYCVILTPGTPTYVATTDLIVNLALYPD